MRLFVSGRRDLNGLARRHDSKLEALNGAYRRYGDAAAKIVVATD